jgi:hypothetical protein
MAEFEELKVYGGVGPYHLNRYRIAFECPSGVAKESLAADFVANFPTYLNSPYATTQPGGHQFNGNDTLKFWGSLKLLGVETNYLHHDWVYQAWKDPRIGFTAQTLKRTFFDATEDVPVAAMSGGITNAIPVVGPLLGPPVGGFSVETNRMHFLAGRRSWRLDTLPAFFVDPIEYNSPPDSPNLLILETVAIERFSDRAFQAGDAVMQLEKSIPPIWISNLENFVRLKGLRPRTRLAGYGRAGWTSSAAAFPTVGSGHVNFYRENFDDLAALKTDIEYYQVIRLFPTVLPSP